MEGLEDREQTEMQPVETVEEESEPSVTEEHLGESDYEALEKSEVASEQGGGGGFGTSMTLLKMSSQEVTVLRSTFDLRRAERREVGLIF